MTNDELILLIRKRRKSYTLEERMWIIMGIVFDQTKNNYSVYPKWEPCVVRQNLPGNKYQTFAVEKMEEATQFTLEEAVAYTHSNAISFNKKDNKEMEWSVFNLVTQERIVVSALIA